MSRGLLDYKRRAPGWSFFQAVIVWGIVGPNLAKIWLKLAHRLKCFGAERIPDDGAIIYVANHQSHYDPPLVSAHAWRRPSKPVARESLFAVPVVGFLLRFIGVQPLKRGETDPAAIRNSLAELERGGCVLIFPEGTRSRDGRTAEFKRGAMLLISRSKARVVPLAVEGAHDAWPPGSKPKLFRRIWLTTGDPIPAEAILAHGKDGGLEFLRRHIETMRLELRAKMRERTKGTYPPPGPADEPYWADQAAPDTAPTPVEA